MILTEAGPHVTRDGDRWSCVEYPRLVMLRGGGTTWTGRGSIRRPMRSAS
jgi:hypothetical protein